MEASLERLRALDGVKWRRHGGEVLAAWVADMDFDTAPVIKRAIIDMAERGDLGYNAIALEALVPAWLDWQERYHHWRPDAEECRSFTGVLHALDMVMMLHTAPGDGVVVFSPIYPPFRSVIEHSGRRVVDVALTGPDWGLDPEHFESHLDADTRVVLFCQPHNPLGRVFDADEVHGFAEVVERHDLLVISDEIWGDLTHDEHRHLPLASLDERLAARTITLSAASKSFSVAGLRCAVAHVGPPEVRETLAAFPSHFIGAPSTVSAVATVAAWTGGHDWLALVKAQLTANLDRLQQRVALDLPGVRMHRPQATYLAWLDFSDTPLAHDPGTQLLERARVALDLGPRFGAQAGAYARLNFATSPEILDAIVDRVADTLSSA
jgi:bifunctional pyridoxal-dependent enzyme with beta-cystathionase and maltose regulon repressor activities